MAKWKPFDLTWGRSIYACSACEEAIEVPTCNGEPLYNFCPLCGANMTMKSENEVADTPQKKDEIVLDPSFAELSDEQFVKAMKLIEPQTDCGWK